MDLPGAEAVDLLAATERTKYAQVWEQHPRYRDVSPGLDIAPMAHGCYQGFAGGDLERGATVLDFGAGTGRASKWFASVGYAPTMVDITRAALNPEMEATRIPFVEACLWDMPADLTARFGFCADVLEHIPPERVRDVIAGIARRTEAAFFQVACFPDRFGPATMGHPLHLTVNPASWWNIELERSWGTVRPLVTGLWSAFFCLRPHA